MKAEVIQCESHLWRAKKLHSSTHFFHLLLLHNTPMSVQVEKTSSMSDLKVSVFDVLLSPENNINLKAGRLFCKIHLRKISLNRKKNKKKTG